VREKPTEELGELCRGYMR